MTYKFKYIGIHIGSFRTENIEGKVTEHRVPHMKVERSALVTAHSGNKTVNFFRRDCQSHTVCNEKRAGSNLIIGNPCVVKVCDHACIASSTASCTVFKYYIWETLSQTAIHPEISLNMAESPAFGSSVFGSDMKNITGINIIVNSEQIEFVIRNDMSRLLLCPFNGVGIRIVKEAGCVVSVYIFREPIGMLFCNFIIGYSCRFHPHSEFQSL